MSGRRARVLFLCICLVVAVLLFSGVLDASVAGIVFAVSLAILGGASNGFRRPAS